MESSGSFNSSVDGGGEDSCGGRGGNGNGDGDGDGNVSLIESICIVSFNSPGVLFVFVISTGESGAFI
jgi:hypothetical protein